MLHGSATRCMSHGTCAVVCLSHSNRLVCRRLASSLHTLRGPIHASQRCIGSVDYWLGAPMVHAAYRYAARCAPKTAEPGSPSSCAGRAARVATDASGSLRARARPQRRAAQRNTSARCLPAADQAACRMRRRQALHEHDRHCMRTAHTASERLNLRHPHAPHRRRPARVDVVFVYGLAHFCSQLLGERRRQVTVRPENRCGLKFQTQNCPSQQTAEDRPRRRRMPVDTPCGRGRAQHMHAAVHAPLQNPSQTPALQTVAQQPQILP